MTINIIVASVYHIAEENKIKDDATNKFEALTVKDKPTFS